MRATISSALGSPHVTQRRLAAANVGLARIGDRLCDPSDGGIGVGGGRPAYGVTGAAVTIDKPCEHRDGLVADLGARIAGQHAHEIAHDIGHVELGNAAALAGEAMQGDLADRGDGVAQSLAKDVCRLIVGEVIEQEEAVPPHAQIGMAERRGLQGSDRDLLAKPHAALRRQGCPASDKVIGKLQVGRRHGRGLYTQ